VRKYWTTDEIAQVRELYPTTPTKQIAELLGRSVLSVYQVAYNEGLYKDADWKRKNCGLQPGNQVGLGFRFNPGHKPFNAGMRRPGYNAGRSKEKWFKPNQRSGKAVENWKPIGTISPDGEGYLRIKVREAVHGKEATGFGNTKVWPLLARHTWEQQNGPIPPKHVIRFKDGNKQNCAIDNLELLSQRENMRRNSFWTTIPRDLAEVMHLNGALKRKLRKYGKEQNV
jgi:hypothetical protein